MKLLRQQEQVIDFNSEYSRLFNQLFACAISKQGEYESAIQEWSKNKSIVLVKKATCCLCQHVELVSSDGASNVTINFCNLMNVSSVELQAVIASRLITFYEHVLQQNYEQLEQLALPDKTVAHHNFPVLVAGSWETRSCWRRNRMRVLTSVERDGVLSELKVQLRKVYNIEEVESELLQEWEVLFCERVDRGHYELDLFQIEPLSYFLETRRSFSYFLNVCVKNVSMEYGERVALYRECAEALYEAILLNNGFAQEEQISTDRMIYSPGKSLDGNFDSWRIISVWRRR